MLLWMYQEEDLQNRYAGMRLLQLCQRVDQSTHVITSWGLGACSCVGVLDLASGSKSKHFWVMEVYASTEEGGTVKHEQTQCTVTWTGRSTGPG